MDVDLEVYGAVICKRRAYDSARANMQIVSHQTTLAAIPTPRDELIVKGLNA